jgi:putative transposase
LYYAKRPENQENLEIMKWMDRQFMQTPYYGVRRMTHGLRASGFEVNHKRVRRLMRLMGLEALYPKPRRTSVINRQNPVYPYRLKGLAIERPNQVWACDITYVPLRSGFIYLVAVMDWYSRYVLSWRVSTSLDSDFCLEALEEAFSKYGKPDIFNTDQGCQFTCQEWIERLQQAGVTISMDGRGRYLDNIFVERLWRTVKYEEIYPKDYETVKEAKSSLAGYFDCYNHRRFHQALDYQTPAQVYGLGVEKPFKTGFEHLSDTG